MSLTKIGSIGINTGIQFAGVTTVSTLHVGSGVTLSSDGDIFATGVSTVTTLKVGSGVTVSSDGDIFATGVTTSTTFSGAFSGSGANITALNASNISSGTVPTARLGSGTASSSTFLRGDSTFQTVSTDLVGDTTPQLGGNLDVNSKAINFGDSNASSTNIAKFGADGDLHIYHEDGVGNVINSYTSNAFKIFTNGNTEILTNNGETCAKFVKNGAVELYHDNNKRLATYNEGIEVFGIEGGNASIKLSADEGDDNNDQYRLIAGNGTSIYLQNYASGGWESNIVATGNGAVELYHDNVKKLETDAGGIKLPSEAGGAQLKVGASGDFTIEHDGSNTYLKNVTGNTVIQNDAVVEITASSGGTKRFRFDSDGLKFGTDTAAANALDDYEEGTFTPRLGGTSNSSTYYVTGSGWYRKIGNMVYTCIRFNGVDLDNNAAGDVKIHNLPFTVNSAASNTDSITTDAAYFNVVFNTSHQYAWYASNGGTSWVGLESRNNTSWDSWNVSDFHASGLYINFSGWYQTNS